MIRPKRYLLKVRGHELQFGDRTLIMGVLNVTPDSFSDGGRFNDPERAVARALELEAQGADIIDIGAESTKPGAKPVSEAEELRRLIPVLKKLEGQLSIPVSVDTYKSGVAEKALEYGVAFINDPSNLTLDPRVANVVAAQDAGLILNHMRGTPETWAKLGNLTHPAESVLSDLENSVNRAQKALVDRQKIIIDPGLGFGKRGDQNWEILARLGKLRELDLPILVGASRKGFLGQKANDSLQQDFATAAAVTGAILEGAHMVRIHKVAALICTVQAADALLRNGPEEKKDHKEKRRIVKDSDRRPYGVGESSDVPGPRDFRPGRPPAPPPAQFDAPPAAEQRPPREERGGDDRPFMKRPLYGGRDERDRPQGNRPYIKRPAYGDRPDRAEQSSEQGRDDRPYGKRPPYGDRPAYGDRPQRSFGGDRDRGGDRPQRSFGGDRDRGGDRPQRSFGGDRDRGGDRPQRSFGGDRDRGGDRPPFRGRPSVGDRPSYGDRPPRSNDGGGRGSFGDRPSRPPFGDRPPRQGGGDRPFRPRFPKPPGFRRG